jgi:hypothetical protein
LKPGSLDRVRQCAAEANENRREEALATLGDETVIIEAYFLESTLDGDSLTAFMKAAGFDKARSAVETSTHQIDRHHQMFERDTWEKVNQLELLEELDRVDKLAG